MTKHVNKILVLFYSFTGHTEKLIEHIQAGAEEFPNTEVVVKRIPELIEDELFEKRGDLREVKEKLEEKYEEATVEDLEGCDGLIVGTPVHFGMMAAQVKQFFDQLSPIWVENKMVNKPVSVFCTSGALHGGEGTTLYTMLIPFMWLGMIPVGIPYPIQGTGPEFDAGSPLGAVFVSGKDGKKPLSKDDQKIARILGRRLAMITAAICVNCVTGRDH